tara:strand:- start:1852 stop:2259 length:408 start_codon:yes stop_codon:yes gene_type:complete
MGTYRDWQAFVWGITVRRMTMKRFCILALTVIIGGVFTVDAYAQGDTIIIDDGDDSVIEGTVDSIRFDNVIVVVDSKKIEVNIDDLDIDNDADSYFPVGSRVQVIGTLSDDDEMDARKMVKLRSSGSGAAQAITD